MLFINLFIFVVRVNFLPLEVHWVVFAKNCLWEDKASKKRIFSYTLFICGGLYSHPHPQLRHICIDKIYQLLKEFLSYQSAVDNLQQ